MEIAQSTQVVLKILLLKSLACWQLELGRLRSPEASAQLLFPI